MSSDRHVAANGAGTVRGSARGAPKLSSSTAAVIAGERASRALDALAHAPPTCPRAMWAEADATAFSVRGATYLEDRVKVSSQALTHAVVCEEGGAPAATSCFV